MTKEIILLNTLEGYRTTQSFGMSVITLSVIDWYKKMYPDKYAQGYRPYPEGGHTGIDLSMPQGTPIFATHAGKVVQDDDTDKGSKGVYVVIVDSVQLIATHYYHLVNNCVGIGQEIAAGQIIGWSGNTGMSDGAHLHFGLCYVDGVSWVRLNKNNKYNGFIDPLGNNVTWIKR